MTLVSLTRNNQTSEWYVNSKNHKIWTNLKDGNLNKWDEDRVYIVDGKEGTGKSLWTLQQAATIDPTLLDDDDGKVLPRICFSVDEFVEALRNTKSTPTHTKVVMFDEGFRGFSSKSTLSKANKRITQTMMEVRQNNLVIFIVSPNIFMLDWYAVQHRAYAFFHIVKEKGSRKRYFKGYNQAKMNLLYDLGKKKGWAYPVKTKHRDWFYGNWPGGAEFEYKYRTKKNLSFKNDEKEEKKEVEGKFKQERRWFLIGWFRAMQKYKDFTQEEFCALLKEWFDLDWDRKNIGQHMDLMRREGKIGRLPD